MQNNHTGHGENHYLRLGGMVFLSFISMYMLMYSMANSLADVYNSLNQVYMAGLMTAPMVVIELWLMSSMYEDKKLNAAVIVVSVAAGILFFALIRQQTLISDRQFLRSMIPHHSGAILMCEDASLHDQRIKDLCKEIISSQRREIDQMRTLLAETAETAVQKTGARGSRPPKACGGSNRIPARNRLPAKWTLSQPCNLRLFS